MQQTRVTGIIKRTSEIGGETTGFLLVLDSHLPTINGLLNEIEVESAGVDLHLYLEKRVEIIGETTKRAGIERREYWVITAWTVRTIQ